MKRWLKITIGILIVLLLIGIVAWRRWSNAAQEVKTHTVERRSLVQEVTFTGHLRSKQRAALAFESTGTLREVNVELGQTVTAGQTLARLDARASSLDAAKARADQAAAATQSYVAWQDALEASGKAATENGRLLETRRQSVRDAKVEMDHSKTVWEQSVRESGDESSTAKARYSAFLVAQSAYRAAQNALTQSQASADTTNQAAQGAAKEAQAAYIATQQAAQGVAGLSSGQALAALANLRVAKTVAVAPFDGVVTTKSFQAGELATAGEIVVTVESTDDLEIVADVSEADISKLTSAMKANFTLDAFADGRHVEAEIVSIAPAAKVLEGVPTYEVVLHVLDGIGDGVKPGMTANVNIVTAQREGVWAVPRRTLIRTGGATKVKILRADETVEERDVKVGLLGSDGFIEITEGLSGAEQIVIPASQ